MDEHEISRCRGHQFSRTSPQTLDVPANIATGRAQVLDHRTPGRSIERRRRLRGGLSRHQNIAQVQEASGWSDKF